MLLAAAAPAHLDENSNVIKKLIAKGLPENTAGQVAGSLPRYWGGLESTSGPAYIGVIICLLALIGFVLVKHPLRWGLLAASVLAIIMSWGKFFPGFNVFLFENLPMYNKFRAPSMALVIVQLTLPVMAVLAVQQLFFESNSRENLKANFKKILVYAWRPGWVYWAYYTLPWIIVPHLMAIPCSV